jgi:polyhydroxyalkanoate synthesis regulator protein
MINVSAPLKLVEEQVRRNTEMLQNAMRMFTPFPIGKAGGAAESEDSPTTEKPNRDTGLDELKEQIAAMQRKLDSLDK